MLKNPKGTTAIKKADKQTGRQGFPLKKDHKGSSIKEKQEQIGVATRNKLYKKNTL